MPLEIEDIQIPMMHLLMTVVTECNYIAGICGAAILVIEHMMSLRVVMAPANLTCIVISFLSIPCNASN